jgi:hypothetical protein
VPIVMRLKTKRLGVSRRYFFAREIQSQLPSAAEDRSRGSRGAGRGSVVLPMEEAMDIPSNEGSDMPEPAPVVTSKPISKREVIRLADEDGDSGEENGPLEGISSEAKARNDLIAFLSTSPPKSSNRSPGNAAAWCRAVGTGSHFLHVRHPSTLHKHGRASAPLSESQARLAHTEEQSIVHPHCRPHSPS